MSPEPRPEPMEGNLSTTNIPMIGGVAHDSDSEDDDIGMAGYVPLSQVPTDTDPMLDDDEDSEWISSAGEPAHGLPAPPLESEVDCCSETIEVWATTHNESNIILDAEKINEVKSVMASFTLPTTAIPEWANTISEDQWKEQLMGRIKEMQNREK